MVIDHSFFDYLFIEEGGGLNEITEKTKLWYNTRYISAFIAIVFVIYNVHFILETDINGLATTSDTLDNYYLLEAAIARAIGLPNHRPEYFFFSLELLILLGYIIKALREAYFIFSEWVSGKSTYRRWNATASLFLENPSRPIVLQCLEIATVHHSSAAPL